MSRSVKGSKGLGYDYGGRRAGNQCRCISPSPFAKLRTHRKERRHNRRLALNEAGRDIAHEDEVLYWINLEY